LRGAPQNRAGGLRDSAVTHDTCSLRVSPAHEQSNEIPMWACTFLSRIIIYHIRYTLWNDDMTVDADTFKLAMRQFGATVTIVATAHEGRRGGLTATAVCSVTMAPPTLLVSVNRSASAYPLLVASRAFSVNVLAARQIEIARSFGAPTGDPATRFEYGAWTAGETGSPLLEDSVVALDCVVVKTIDIGTHSLFIGTPLDIIVNAPCAMLGYLDGQFTSIERRNIGRKPRDTADTLRSTPAAFFDGLI
jgi:flavin reductase (DIM6/NTAB) family NADH-FMN oxidoreductase RutF